MNILLIEDERRVADFVRRGLAAEGWSIDHACDGETGLEYAQSSSYDVVVVDLMLPGIQGQDVCRKLRARGWNNPILVLSALDSPQEKAEGLRIGADDYLAKPFEFDELIARLEALHRRATNYTVDPSDWNLAVGDIIVDRESMKITVGEIEIELSKKERDLLILFMSNVDRVLSRERILNTVWGANADPMTNIVDVYVGRVRRKIGKEGARIVTVRNVGYRMS